MILGLSNLNSKKLINEKLFEVDSFLITFNK